MRSAVRSQSPKGEWGKVDKVLCRTQRSGEAALTGARVGQGSGPLSASGRVDKLGACASRCRHPLLSSARICVLRVRRSGPERLRNSQCFVRRAVWATDQRVSLGLVLQHIILSSLHPGYIVSATGERKCVKCWPVKA